MQVEALKVADFIKTNEETASIKGEASLNKTEEKAYQNKELKSLSVDNNFYNNKGIAKDDEDLKKDVEQLAEMGQTTYERCKNLSKAWDDGATEEAEDKGLDPMNLEADILVTVVDEIKMNLAKAGVDISKMGGLSDSEIEAMSGSLAQAMEMEKGLEDSLSDESIKYLVTNELEPTITNIYNATYALPGTEDMSGKSFTKEISDEELINLLDELGSQLDTLIDEAEIAADETSKEDAINLCSKMIKQDIPLTAENLRYMDELSEYEKPSEDEILSAIGDIVKEGKDPKDAYLVNGYSLMDQAREAVEEINSIDESTLTEVQEYRKLEEVRLMMTVEATFTMMKNGIEVNTNDLTDLVEKLKNQELGLLKMLCGGKDDTETDSNVEKYLDTMDAVSDIENGPLAAFSRFSNIGQATLSEIRTVSVSMTVEYSRMEATYEAVGTEVRKDLGDNIKTAFRNVDAILEEMGLDTNESNEKAVRTLAYNEMEITEESVTKMKDANELVGRTFKNMTPAVVSEIIKRGENPLDMKINDLKDMTEEIKADLSNSSDNDEQSFSKFLWKAEHTGDITEEERESYIGIYRLLDKVEKSDGAAIGALIGQGSEVTLRNLMTAVRSSKHTGREYEVSDNSGAVELGLDSGLSITEQVEKVFLTNRCRDAKEAMTPAKMMGLDSEEMLNMDPDEFASAMENPSISASEAEEEINRQYMQNITEQIRESVLADEDVYEMLEEYNIPATANMISALSAMKSNRNQMINDLAKAYSESQDMDIEFLMEELTERFGEAAKTPEEMAEAEEALETLAENVMKTMITEEDVTTYDLDGMKLIVSEAKAYNTMARESETYHLPMMVADETGTMTLKIVRGTGESGLVKMALYMESTGSIASTFKYEDGQVNGQLDFDDASIRDMFAGQAPLIAQTMQEECGYSFSFSFGTKSELDVNEIYKRETGAFDLDDDEKAQAKSNEIQTKALYGIASSFIKVMGEVFS